MASSRMFVGSARGFSKVCGVFLVVLRKCVQCLLLLLAGSTKKDQDATIAKAKKDIEDYERRGKRKQ